MGSIVGDIRRHGRRWGTYALVVGIALVMTAGISDQVLKPAAPTKVEAVAPFVSTPPPAIVIHPIAGWIVDGAGQPIAGVRVTVRDSAGAIADVIADSGAEGEFRIPPSPLAEPNLLFDAAHVFPAQVLWRTDRPPPRILLARRASLHARVLIDGKPAADAEVRITDGSQPTLVTARSDQGGLVRFNDLVPGPYEIWATREAMASALVRVDNLASEHGVELALEPAGTVQGQVIADGQLPAGTIQLAPLDIDHAVRIATLDDQGRFVIDGVPRGRWRVEAAVPGYVQSIEQIATVTAKGEPLVVRLQRAGLVSGTVVDANGAPVANATIVLRNQSAQPARPLEQRVLSAARLRWVHPLAGRRYLPVYDATRFGAARPGSRPTECGQGHCGVDLGSVRGLVVHSAADGEIVAAYTDIRGDAGRFIAIDHGDGLRTMYMHLDELREGLEPGHKVRAGDPIGTTGSTGIIRSVPHLHFAVTQERFGRTLYLDPEPMLRHAVVLASPKPLDRVGQNAITLIASTRATELWASPLPAQALTTDARGGFTIAGVEPGSYVAVAFALDLAPGASSPFAVTSGLEATGVVITLRPGVMVRGRVVGRHGPINGATIIAGAGFGETANKIATAYTDPQGEFLMRALSGKVTLAVTAAGYGEATRTLVLDERDSARARQREEFLLTIEDAQLRGQVIAPDGGAAGVSVRIIEGPSRRTTLTDAQGRFTIDRVASGRYVVELTAADYPSKRVTLQSDRFHEVRLDQGGGARALISDVHSGAALAGIRVDATGPDGKTISRTSDEHGFAELRGLSPGTWKLTVRARGYTVASHPVAIRASRVVQDVRIDLVRGATLAGVVRDRNGARVAGARVWLGSASTQTDGDGNFQLTDVPTGAGVLQAELDAKRGTVSVQLAPGDERMTLTIELAE